MTYYTINRMLSRNKRTKCCLAACDLLRGPTWLS